MDPHVYPDPQVAPLRLPPATGTVVATFTPIEQLAAPDPTTPDIPKTMFIRIAMSAAGVVNPTAPSLYLKANTGDAVLLSTNQTVSINRSPGAPWTDYVADAMTSLESTGAGISVFLVAVTFYDGLGAFNWQLGIGNTAAAPREFTWVVSGTSGNTAQPWIDLDPAMLSWEVPVNGSQADSVKIRNKGTGPFIVSGVSPALPAGFVLGALPAGALNPGAWAPLTVTFTAPAEAPLPNGVVTANGIVTINPVDQTARTVGVGHNKQLSISAKVFPSIRIGGVRGDGLETDFFLQVGGTVAGNAVGNIIVGLAQWDT